MIQTMVVGHGLAGRVFHCPLIRRQPDLNLHGIVARDPTVRAEAVELWQVRGYASLDEALDDPKIQLVVIATPHNTHAELAVRALEAGRHCVVDKVMALTTEQADAMIAARDRSGRMLSVFHNRRWDWDFVTIMALAGSEVVLIRATFAASPSSSAVSGPSADGPDCLDDQTQTGQTGRPQGDGAGSTQPRRPVGECHAAGSVPFEPNGLNPDLGADDGMFRALIDRREPARIVRPVDHQVARPIVFHERRPAVPRDHLRDGSDRPGRGRRLVDGSVPNRLDIRIEADARKQGPLMGSNPDANCRPRRRKRFRVAHEPPSGPARRAGRLVNQSIQNGVSAFQQRGRLCLIDRTVPDAVCHAITPQPG
jgi:hypothetical protein